MDTKEINWEGAFNRFNTPPDAIIASYDDEQMNTKKLETHICNICQKDCQCRPVILASEQPINTGCAVKSYLEIIKQIEGCIRVESALLNELRKACE